MDRNHLSMLTDFYEITMANGYLQSGLAERITYFDMFFRKIPDDGGFAIMAGVEQMLDYFDSLHFTREDIDYLRSLGLFCEEFLQYIEHFRFCCDVWAAEEGTPIFPYEPVVTVRGPAIQAQFVETMILLSINHQSLIATKANRIVRAAQGRAVMEFGSRRAQGYDGAVYGARAAYIGGCAGTACALAGSELGIPVMGTMAHSWVQLFDSEREAFEHYAKIYPNNCTLLVDTYDVLHSGLPNAIRVFRETLAPMGFRPKGIRIDSGDVTYLSRKARQMLDEAGFEDCRITASNALDETLIADMIHQGACVDSFGVGERLITAASDPVFGGVYKLAAVEENGEIVPRIKISENVTKITNPCFKKVWRLYDNASDKAIADVITLHSETIDSAEPYELFDPDHLWKRKTVRDFHAVELLKPMVKHGKRVYRSPKLGDIRDFCAAQLETLWDEVKRFEHPHTYYVDLSQSLWDEKQRLLAESSAK